MAIALRSRDLMVGSLGVGVGKRLPGISGISGGAGTFTGKLTQLAPPTLGAVSPLSVNPNIAIFQQRAAMAPTLTSVTAVPTTTTGNGGAAPSAAGGGLLVGLVILLALMSSNKKKR